MSNASFGSGSVQRTAPSPTRITPASALGTGVALLILAGLLLAAYVLHNTSGRGAPAALALLLGAGLGIVFERGRFCFFCILRDYIEYRNSGPIYALLAALAVSGVGYAIVLGAFLPNPFIGRLAPDAHIGPVSWALLAAGLAFGVGMALSGACISGHLYRLGEGYSRAPLALIGSVLGFGVGFLTWNPLYLATIASAPVPWLPAWMGYGAALAVHLLLLGVLALVLLRRIPELPARPARVLNLTYLHDKLLRERWNPLVTGSLVGIIGVIAYLRIEPLGVTSQLGSLARTTLHSMDLLPSRLNGLDSFAGCATLIVQTISDNGLLITGLVFGSLSTALLAKRFQITRLTLSGSVSALLGGILMGWGAMIGLGCTVGTLLSGIAAFAPSGWVFAAAMFGGVWIGIKLRLHRWG